MPEGQKESRMVLDLEILKKTRSSGESGRSEESPSTAPQVLLFQLQGEAPLSPPPHPTPGWPWRPGPRGSSAIIRGGSQKQRALVTKTLDSQKEHISDVSQDRKRMGKVPRRGLLLQYPHQSALRAGTGRCVGDPMHRGRVPLLEDLIYCHLECHEVLL